MHLRGLAAPRMVESGWTHAIRSPLARQLSGAKRNCYKWDQSVAHDPNRTKAGLVKTAVHRERSGAGAMRAANFEHAMLHKSIAMAPERGRIYTFQAAPSEGTAQ
jgi:hypothetical protein